MQNGLREFERRSRFWKTVKGDVSFLRQLLSLLKDGGVARSLMKFSFLSENINYLRRVIRPGRLEIFSTTVSAIKYLKDPTN